MRQALEDLDTTVGTEKSRHETWSKRQGSFESNWAQMRATLVQEMLKREGTPGVCGYCKETATIKCYSCKPIQEMCSKCDIVRHKNDVYHDRQWFHGFFHELSPLECIKDGCIIQICEYITNW